MPQHNARNQTTRAEDSDHTRRSAAAALTQARFTEMGARNVKAGLRIQKEMFDTLQDISRDWVARAASEAELACTLPNRLRDAHSVPDALSAYQEWLREWLALCGEDGRRFVSDSQKIVNTGVRCLSSAALQ